MKKVILIIILCALIFSGCNYQLVDLNYTFSYAYIKVGDEWVTVELSSWKDYEGEQIQLTLRDGTVLLVNSMNCILYKGELPR